MELRNQRASHNVEDRRGMGAAAGGLGVGGIVIALIAYFLGFDPGALVGVAEQVGAPQQQRDAPRGAPADEMGQFVSRVLGSTEDVWARIFGESGAQYQPPTLVLYDGQVRSACGMGQAAMGPFYCPGDEKVYLDLAFFEEMARRFRAGGDFARAYVIAHEIGHHVQRLTGVTAETEKLRVRLSPVEYNKVSVRVELQADCFAGVWAQHANRARPFLDPGDVEEALAAANAIGDDALQRQSQGVVVPDSFTHGSSAQRMRWFRAGFESGSLKSCDTFAAAAL